MIANLRGVSRVPRCTAGNNKFLHVGSRYFTHTGALRAASPVSFSPRVRRNGSRIAVRERKKNRTRANQRELMETNGAPFSLFLIRSRICARVSSSHRPIRKGSRLLRCLQSTARRKATSGSQDEPRENRDGELNRSRTVALPASPQGCPCFV